MLLSKLKIRNNRVITKDFKEEEHPRSKEGFNAGQFVKKGEEGSSSNKKEDKFINIEK